MERGMELEGWFQANTFHHSRFSDIGKLVKLKEEQKLTISVGLPTLNEAETIAKEIMTIRSMFIDLYPLVDELAIVDSGSTDATRDIAREYGADVYEASHYLKELGICYGKGENLWKSLYLLKGDILLWLDADIKNIAPKFVYGLLGPLLANPEISYVKAFYERPLKLGPIMRPSGGGRVTEILIRPLFNLFFPELSGLIQPLSGEYAGRRETLEQVPFFVGYGVETGLLIDISKKFGLEVIAQVDLDRRVHRNQRLEALSRMSFGILQVFLNRAQALGKLELRDQLNQSMNLIKAKEREYLIKTQEIKVIERPPMITIEAYRRRRGVRGQGSGVRKN